MSPEKMQKYQREINACPLLEDVTLQEIEEMGDHARVEVFPEGQVILSEGKMSQGLWLILSGKCDVIKHCGKEPSVLSTLEPGNVFGEMSFFEMAPHSATVQAIEEVKALCLGREEFEELRETCPSISEKIAVNIVKLLSDRLRRMDVWTCELVETEKNPQRHQEWHDFRARLYSNIFD